MTPPRTPPRRAAAGTGFTLALVGFLLALATAGYVVYRDPPWGRLGRYDFRTPEAALKSQARMQLNADVRAMVEYGTRVRRKELQEKMDSLKVEKTRTFDKREILFVSYKEEGKDVKRVQWFERDDDTGFWRPTYESSFKVREKDPGLAKEIDEWDNDRPGMPGLGPD